MYKKCMAVLGSGLMLFVVGCGTVPKELGFFPPEKMVVVNGRGDLLEPVGNVGDQCYSSLREMKVKVPFSEEDDYLEKVVANIEEQLSKGEEVVLFIHGGLNTQVGSMKRADALFDFERCFSNEAPHFVMINWQSSLVSSYADRLFAIREGKDFRNRGDAKGPMTKLSSPLYVSSDVLSMVARSPVSIERQAANFVTGFHVFKKAEDVRIADAHLVKQGVISADAVHPRAGFHLKHHVWSLCTSPLRVLVTPIVDVLGSKSWGVMKRRTSILFDRDVGLKSGSKEWAQGPLYKLGAKLAAVEGGGGKFTLVCHSMGAILGAELMQRFPALHFDRVVFMAAACPVRTLTDRVFPYLVRKENKETVFYSLTLHPDAEVREKYLGGVAPLGSLLVWLDQMFENPGSALDRMAGRYVNLGLNAGHLATEIQRLEALSGVKLNSRLHLKCFPYEKGGCPGVPMKHGDFGQFNFWDEAFYAEEDRRRYFKYEDVLKNSKPKK